MVLVEWPPGKNSNFRFMKNIKMCEGRKETFAVKILKTIWGINSNFALPALSLFTGGQIISK